MRLSASRAEVVGCPGLRPDAHIRLDVMRSLLRARVTPAGAEVHASVFRGVVALTVHAAGAEVMRRAVECARGVPGVVAVRDRTGDG